MPKESKLYTILKEPLVHFLLIGTALFFIYAQLNDDIIEEGDNQIHITKADIDKLNKSWLNKKGKNPTEKEKEELLKNFIEEEILYREALAKGLDKNDNTIRLHLAKKMKFVFDDLAMIKEPTNAQLEEYLANNSIKFMESASISFNQVLFTQNNESKDINKEAKEFLQKLQKSKSKKISTIGDLVELSKKGITNMFGDEFADSVFNLATKQWHGVIKSKYGLHLIYVHSLNKAKVPKLSDIREKVATEWRKEKLNEANKVFYKSLYKNYDIIIDNDLKKVAK